VKIHNRSRREAELRDKQYLFVDLTNMIAKISGKDTPSFQKGGRTQGQTIFVRGFNKYDGEDQIRSSLEEHFGSCGEIARVSIPTDQDGGVKGSVLTPNLF
ncbi:Nucleolin 2, partial [Sesamum angolense]